MKTLNFNPIRTVIEKLKSIHADPMKICYGFAFGTFMCTTPLIGIKWIVALPILWFTKWNKVACMIGIFQVNSLTGPLFYTAAYFIGSHICGYQGAFEFPDQMSFNAVKDLFFSSTEVFLSILTGGLVLSVPMTLGAFYLAKTLFARKSQTQLT